MTTYTARTSENGNVASYFIYCALFQVYIVIYSGYALLKKALSKVLKRSSPIMPERSRTRHREGKNKRYFRLYLSIMYVV